MFPSKWKNFGSCTSSDGHYYVVLGTDALVMAMRDGTLQAELAVECSPRKIQCTVCTVGICVLLQWDTKIIVWNISTLKTTKINVDGCVTAFLLHRFETLILQKQNAFLLDLSNGEKRWSSQGKYSLCAVETQERHIAFATSNHFIDFFPRLSSKAVSTNFARPIDCLQFLRLSTVTLLCVVIESRTLLDVFEVVDPQNQSFQLSKSQLLKVASVIMTSPTFCVVPSPPCLNQESLRNKLQIVTVDGAGLSTSGLRFAAGCLPSSDSAVRAPAMLQGLLSQFQFPIRCIEALPCAPVHRPEMTRPSAVVDKFFVSAKNELQLLIAFENGLLVQVGADLGECSISITHFYCVGDYGRLSRVQMVPSGRFAATTYIATSGLRTSALFGLGTGPVVLLSIAPMKALEEEGGTSQIISRNMVLKLMETHCPALIPKFDVLLQACGGNLEKLKTQLERKHQVNIPQEHSARAPPREDFRFVESERSVTVVDGGACVTFSCDIHPIFGEACAEVFNNVLPFVPSMYSATVPRSIEKWDPSQGEIIEDLCRGASLKAVRSPDQIVMTVRNAEGADVTLPPCNLPSDAKDVRAYFHNMLNTVFVTAHAGSSAYLYSFSPTTQAMERISLGSCGDDVVATLPHRRGVVLVTKTNVIQCQCEGLRISSCESVWTAPARSKGVATIVSAASAGSHLCLGSVDGEVFHVQADPNFPMEPSLFNPAALYGMFSRGDYDAATCRLRQILGTAEVTADPLRALLHQRLPQDLTHDGGPEDSLPILISSPQVAPVGPNTVGDAAKEVSALLPNVVLHNVNSTDQLVLTCIAESIHQCCTSAPGLDVGASRFAFDFLLKIQCKKFRAQAPNPFTSTTVLWAAASETQEQLYDFLVGQQKGTPFLWTHMGAMGCSVWIKSTILLKKAVEQVAKGHYQQSQRDCKESALFYILLGKRGVLAALCKASNELKLHQFFSRDFSDPKNKQSATTNAFVAIGKGNILFGCAFFLLAGDIRGAAQTAIQRLGDWQLALLIIRLAAAEDSTADLEWLWSFLQTCPDVKMDAWERAGLQWRLGGPRWSLKYILTESPNVEALHFFQYCSKTVPAVKCGDKILPVRETVGLMIGAAEQCAFRGEWTQAQELSEGALQELQAVASSAAKSQAPKFAADVNSGTLVFRNDSDDDEDPTTSGFTQHAAVASHSVIEKEVQFPVTEMLVRMFCKCIDEQQQQQRQGNVNIQQKHNPVAVTMGVISSHHRHSDAECEQRIRHLLANNELAPTLAKTLTFVGLSHWAFARRDLALCVALVSEGLPLNELFGQTATADSTGDHGDCLSAYLRRLCEKKFQVMQQETTREPSLSSFDDLSGSVIAPLPAGEESDETVTDKLLLLFDVFVCFQVRHAIVLRKLPLSLAASCLLLHFCDRACRASDRLAQLGGAISDDNGLFMFIRRQIRICFATVAAVEVENEHIDRVCYQTSRTLCQHLLTSTEHLPDLSPIDLTSPLKHLRSRSETHRGARQLLKLIDHHREVLSESIYLWSRERQSHCRARRTFLTVAINRSIALTEKATLCQQTHETTSLCFDTSSFDTLAVATSGGTHLIHGQRDALVRDNEAAVDHRAAARKAAAQAFSFKELCTPTTVSPSSAGKRPNLGGVTSTLLLSHPHLPFFIGARNAKTLDVFHYGSKDAVSTFEHATTSSSDSVTAMDFSPNGRFLLVGSKGGCVTCWKFSSAMEKSQPLFQDNNVMSRVTAVRFLPNFSCMYAVGGVDSFNENKFSVKIFDGVLRGLAVQSCLLPFRPDYIEVNYANPAELLCCSEQGECAVYDLKRQQTTETRHVVDPAKKTLITCLAASMYDPGFFAFGTSKSELALCTLKLLGDDVQLGPVLTPCATTCINPTHRTTITDVKFSPSSLVYCCSDGKVCAAPLIPEGARELFL